MGIFRFILAFLVVLSHLPGSAMRGNLGESAVIAFYFISGWLMTHSYRAFQKNSVFPIRTFFIDRVIRLYPTFILIFTISLAFMIWAHLPFSWRRVAMEPFVFPLAYTKLFPFGTNGVPIVPPSWSLGVEAHFYLFIPLWLALALNFRVVFTCVLAIVHIVVLATPGSVQNYIGCPPFVLQGWCDNPFSDVFGYDMPFIVATAFLYGSITYDRVVLKQGRFAPIVFIWALYASALWLFGPPFKWLENMSAYDIFLGIVVFAPFAVLVFQTRLEGKARRIDWLIGNLSYPLFLVHFLAIKIVVYVAGSPEVQPPLYIPTLLLSVGLAIVVALFQSIAVDRLRYRVRGFGSTRP
jgi:peptidoglycan/LPS O-acetylase OafA/YrhL